MALPIESKKLYVPELTEVAEVLSKGLKDNFEHVKVEVVDCPDLTEKPFTLANKGLNGKPCLVEIGGPSYLLPVPDKNKLYDIKDIAKLVNVKQGFIIGAGAGPFPFVGPSEAIFNLSLLNGGVDQQSRIAKVNTDTDLPMQAQLPNTETRFALLGNLFISEGKPGKVLKIYVKKRIGCEDFISSIRKALANRYGNNIVGLGGAFLLKEGKAKQHVMPEFSTDPLRTEEEFNKWLRFYDMSAPLIALGTFVTGDYDLDLRVQHFHSFSHHDEAGHYHNDTTPDSVEYLGYFNIAEVIHRIDRPDETYNNGLDYIV